MSGVTWGQKSLSLLHTCSLHQVCFLGASALWSFCASLWPALIRSYNLASSRMHHPARVHMWAAASEKETGGSKVPSRFTGWIYHVGGVTAQQRGSKDVQQCLEMEQSSIKYQLLPPKCRMYILKAS